MASLQLDIPEGETLTLLVPQTLTTFLHTSRDQQPGIRVTIAPTLELTGSRSITKTPQSNSSITGGSSYNFTVVSTAPSGA